MQEFEFNLGTGRREPETWEHLEKYPARAASRFETSIESVNRLLTLPHSYRKKYHQKEESSCVGHSLSWMSSIHQLMQHGERQFYDARWLYEEAQKIDEWQGAEPDYYGTSVNAGLKVLKAQGHKFKHQHNHEHLPERDQGIETYRWATSIDEIRTAISQGLAVVVGTNWYESMFDPEKIGTRYWIGRNQNDLGRPAGGHAYCLYGASDKLQAFKICNSWGSKYPLTWIPYEFMQRLINENGEAAIVTDR
jgi:hypothetical protein